MYKFKQVFRRTLKQVKVVYQDAKFEADRDDGMLLRHSWPPVLKRIVRVK